MGSTESKLKNSNYNHDGVCVGDPDRKRVSVSVTIEHRGNTKYNESFERIVPYNKNYPFPIKSFIMELIDKINQKHKAKNFKFWKIKKTSFINEEINCNVLEHFTPNITDYDTYYIVAKGLHIIIGDISIPVNIKCKRNEKHNRNLKWVVPYDLSNEYKVSSLLKEIIDFVNNQSKPMVFIIKKVKSQSFIAIEMNNDDYDWNNLNANITSYAKDDITEKGLSLNIDVDAYEHDICSVHPICDNMNNKQDLCPIYAKMRYQNIFTEKDLIHLYDYEHPNDTQCKYDDECYAYKRLEKGGNDLKDRCHVTIYKHPPRGRQLIINDETEEINPFCLNDEWSANYPLWRPTEEDKRESQYNEQNGFLNLLIQEVIDNGFKSDLCLIPDHEDEDNYSLLEIVEEKLKCKRHQFMGCPLNKSEMLSLLLYTGGDSNYDLCKTQRNCDYHKWKWFDYCLFNAINKLSKREYGSYKIYTGLGSTKMRDKYVECGYFKTYVSTSWMKQIALTFVDTDGMLFEIQESFREKAICCDVSWISKFGLNECEILIARSIDAVLNSFECKIIDHMNGTQIVSLQLYGEQKQKRALTNDGIDDIQYIDESPVKPLTQRRYHIKMYNMDRVDEKLKNIVYGYIHIMERSSSFEYEIPLDVFLICFSFYYRYPQRKCIAAQLREEDRDWFFVGQDQELHLIEYTDDIENASVHEAKSKLTQKYRFNHLDEIYSISPSPNKDFLFTTHRGGLMNDLLNLDPHLHISNPHVYKATLWRLPDDMTEDSIMELKPILTLPTKTHLLKQVSTNLVVWDPVNTEHIVSLADNCIISWQFGGTFSIITEHKCIYDENRLHRLMDGCFDPHYPNRFISVNDKAIRVWSTKYNELLEIQTILNAHDSCILSVDHNPNKPYHIVTSSQDGMVKFWDLRQSKEPIKVIPSDGSGAVPCVQFNKYHDQLIISQMSYCISLWNVESISTANFEVQKNDDKLIQRYIYENQNENGDNVSWSCWSVCDAWRFVTLSCDGKVEIYTVPNQTKYKILL